MSINETHDLCAFVQARMSSHRFPGKVLAPFRGRPLIDWVLDGVRRGVPEGTPVVVATSDHVTDDPLVAYLSTIEQPWVRGPLDDVMGRFRLAVERWPCRWLLRFNADSPLLDPAVIREVLAIRDAGADLVTTTFPRTFPKGQNVELLDARVLRRLDDSELDAADREHVTRFFYLHPERFRIVNVQSSNPALLEFDFAVDTIDDLRRLERLPVDRIAQMRGGDACTPPGH